MGSKDVIRDFVICVFERMQCQPRPNLSSLLVLEELENEAGLCLKTRCIMIVRVNVGLNMILRWHYVVLSMEQSMNVYISMLMIL